ncbi:Synaptic vesicle glycoprotein 2C [Eumeta japonica]|uniref:Synaptic vesicle glycoprotein 2C n=1 Tax=Eumeta variegata TaxID=151549 RepID=A0A4C1X7R9_EUMVA|nr:Synaptic vesicle glycoprotein 2C [Eumeta japonica]
MGKTENDAEAASDAETRSACAEEIPHDHLYKVTGLSSTKLEKLAEESEPEAADFEAAISATGYGKFNILLMLSAFPAFWSSVSVTSSVSYIFTRAKCDMQLSLLNMGTITAITYGGMISSALLWGFLSDTLGRRRIMIWGFFCSGLVELTAALSQNFSMLLVTRFLAGFLFNGPFAVLLSYIAELHRTELRARVILYTSLFYTIAHSTLPLLAWAVLTKAWEFKIYGKFVIHAWNVFLVTTALMPMLSCLAFAALPESPKFLMSRGRNEEAMAVFKRMYSENTGNPPDQYPVRKLFAEKTVELARGVAALRGGVRQMAPMVRAPHGLWLLLMCLILIGLMFGSNTLRLWFPQLVAMIGAEDGGSLCTAIAPVNIHPVVPEEVETCKPIETNMMTYLQSVVVGTGSVLSYGIGGLLVNCCGKKLVAGVCIVACAAVVIVLPLLGSGSSAVVGLVTTALALTSLADASLSSIMVDLFPTSMRVMALATFLMSGRMGTIIGTVAFPALLSFGCFPPFIVISTILLTCAAACVLIPNTNMKKLE